MEEEVKKLRKMLVDQRGIDKRTNVYQGIFEDLKRWATFLPLLAELKDPAMQTEDDRHWKMLKELVRQDFVIDEEL